ncbi:hypothetical protein SUGI_0580590 [Cryptomeria japonica]|nr:hypothetical protein SUGI_0580590 [Cryptomeria japonica]
MKNVSNTKDDDDEDSKSALLINGNGDLNGRRKLKVQWNDTNGKELTSVWKFEPSDSDSDDDKDNEHSQACSCVIM